MHLMALRKPEKDLHRQPWAAKLRLLKYIPISSAAKFEQLKYEQADGSIHTLAFILQRLLAAVWMGMPLNTEDYTLPSSYCLFGAMLVNTHLQKRNYFLHKILQLDSLWTWRGRRPWLRNSLLFCSCPTFYVRRKKVLKNFFYKYSNKICSSIIC